MRNPRHAAISLNQWVSNTLMSRLDNKQTGAIIVVMQRVHMDDLSGFLSSSADDWEVLSLPGNCRGGRTHPDRQWRNSITGELAKRCTRAHESLETMRNQQKIMGPDVFAAQYQQSPVPAGGAMIRRDWLRYYDVAPDRQTWQGDPELGYGRQRRRTE